MNTEIQSVLDGTSQGCIVCGDCITIVDDLPRARMVFMDPPDNLGVNYDGFKDKMTKTAYIDWLREAMADGLSKADIMWLSCYYTYQPDVWIWWSGCRSIFRGEIVQIQCRMFPWRFTFGQHRETDCGNGYRPIFRFNWGDVTWNTDDIRVQSQRQRNGDSRANPDGRVPDDVFEFSRVCGTFKERRKWHPNQHSEALIERIVRMSTKEGDLVYDLCAGTGTVNRVCKRLGRRCIGIEISETYCRKIAEENGLPLVIEASSTKARTVADLRSALYQVCCKLQELEHRLDKK
jgi:DNA modification methylase